MTKKSQEQNVTALYDALTNLVQVLEVMGPQVDNVIVFARAHGYKYLGPSWGDQLAEAKRVLALE